MPGFGIKDIADSGSEVDEKTNTSAPKSKKLQSVVTLQFLDLITFIYSCANSV
jgi:hypothetical protein